MLTSAAAFQLVYERKDVLRARRSTYTTYDGNATVSVGSPASLLIVCEMSHFLYGASYSSWCLETLFFGEGGGG